MTSQLSFAAAQCHQQDLLRAAQRELVLDAVPPRGRITGLLHTISSVRIPRQSRPVVVPAAKAIARA